MNRYAYVLNNPLRLVDPFGLDCVFLDDTGGVRAGIPGGFEIDPLISQSGCNAGGGYFFNGTVDPNNLVLDPNSNIVGYNGPNGLQVACQGGPCGNQSVTVNGGPDSPMVLDNRFNGSASMCGSPPLLPCANTSGDGKENPCINSNGVQQPIVPFTTPFGTGRFEFNSAGFLVGLALPLTGSTSVNIQGFQIPPNTLGGIRLEGANATSIGFNNSVQTPGFFGAYLRSAVFSGGTFTSATGAVAVGGIPLGSTSTPSPYLQNQLNQNSSALSIGGAALNFLQFTSTHITCASLAGVQP